MVREEGMSSLVMVMQEQVGFQERRIAIPQLHYEKQAFAPAVILYFHPPDWMKDSFYWLMSMVRCFPVWTSKWRKFNQVAVRALKYEWTLIDVISLKMIIQVTNCIITFSSLQRISQVLSI